MEGAEDLQLQVLQIRKRALGAEHRSTLQIMNSLALTYRSQGRWKEAEELEVQVVETSTRVLVAEHPDTLTGMADLSVDLQESRSVEGGRRVGSASSGDENEGTGCGASRYAEQ